MGMGQYRGMREDMEMEGTRRAVAWLSLYVLEITSYLRTADLCPGARAGRRWGVG